MYAQHHQDALELEVTVLSRLLQRNQCSHRRSKPFQHASMALRCLLLRGSAGARSSKQDDRKSPPPEQIPYLQLFASSQELLRRAEETVNRRRAKRKRQQVFWELSSSDVANEVSEVQELRRRHEDLVRALHVHNMQELFSRFDSAAAYLFSEIARGFFLPFMTVAIAALARIRMLSLQLFLHVTDAVLPQVVGFMRELALDDDEEEDATDTRSIEDVRAFLASQANLNRSDIPSADDSSTRSSKERKRIREDARRTRFLRDLGLPARTAAPIFDNAIERSEPIDASSRPDETVPQRSRQKNDDDSTDSVLNAVPATRRDRGSPEALNDEPADGEIVEAKRTREWIDLLDASASNDGEDDAPRPPPFIERPPEDRGESVAVVAAAAVPDPAPGFGRRPPPPQPAHRDDGILDKNLAWAERLGREKKKSKTKTTTTQPSKKRKQEKGRGAPTLPSTRQDGEGTGSLASQVKRPKPTKKPKESRGGDFFDDLFG